MENKRKDVEEKEKALTELDRQLKKRKEQMDQMEASLRKVSLKYLTLIAYHTVRLNIVAKKKISH